MDRAILTPSQRFLGSRKCLHASAVHRTISTGGRGGSPHLDDRRLSLYVFNLCYQEDSQHPPWTDSVPSVWNALFFAPSFTLIQPVNPHSASKTAQAHTFCEAFAGPPRAPSYVPSLNVHHTHSGHRTHCTWYTCLLVHFPKAP